MAAPPAVGEKNSPLLELGTRRLGLTLARVAVPSFSSETSPAGAVVYTVHRFFRLLRRSRFESEECAMAARRTERFTDHATIPRHARTASPISPSIAPTAMKTVPSGMFDVCMYGAFSMGGTVTMGPLAVVEAESVAVVVETDVVVVLSVVDVSDEEVVVVVSMAVVEVESDDVALVVLSDVGVVSVVEAVVLGVLSVVEGSAVVWAAVSVV